MLIYNVTINVEESVKDSWVSWMMNTHIPDVLATGKFLEATMTRVLVDEEMGGITYSVQYKVKNRETLDLYYQNDAEHLRNETIKLFGNSLVAFRTELEVLTIEKPLVDSATEYLFTYGTLQDKEVQQMVFSRILSGRKDHLKDHTISKVLVGGLYPSVEASTKSVKGVPGILYIISKDELRRVDIYEGDAYYRKKAMLGSGIEAWVYQGKSES
ncbi:MAG: DUF4286 family protein [Eudoraea sp.]|nr:DUF4286 family protein [Eudoraea sp.]